MSYPGQDSIFVYEERMFRYIASWHANALIIVYGKVTVHWLALGPTYSQLEKKFVCILYRHVVHIHHSAERKG